MMVSSPAYYRIYVQGDVDLHWITDYFNLRTERLATKQQLSITILAGELIDQAALLGLLSLINESGLSLLGFDCYPYQ